MSTYAYAKLIVADKKQENIRKVKDVNVNYMKNTLFGPEWPDDFFGFEPDLNVDAQQNFLGYVKQNYLDDENFKKHIFDKNEKEKALLVDEMFDTRPGVKAGKIELCDDPHEVNEYWYTLYRKNSNYNIVWLTEGILSSYIEKQKVKLVQNYEKLAKKKAIQDSVEYYNLSEDARNALSSDIEYLEEDIDDIFSNIESARQLIGLMSGFREIYEEDWEDQVYCALYLC